MNASREMKNVDRIYEFVRYAGRRQQHCSTKERLASVRELGLTCLLLAQALFHNNIHLNQCKRAPLWHSECGIWVFVLHDDGVIDIMEKEEQPVTFDYSV